MAERKRIPWWLGATLIVFAVFVYVIIQFDLRGGLRSFLISENEPKSDPTDRLLRIRPAELITSELKWTKEHVKMAASGSVKLDMPGPGIMIGIKRELWRNGKAEWLGTGRDFVKEPHELSFSLGDVAGGNGKQTLDFVLVATAKERGFKGTDTSIVDVPKLSGQSLYFSTEKLSRPQELKEGEMLAVWAYTVPEQEEGKPYSPIKFQSIEEAAKAARWAFVVKMWWQTPENHEKAP